MNITEGINARYSCRDFKKGMSLTPENIEKLANCIDKAPNGIGLENWKFIFIDGDREELRKASYGQAPITDSSMVIAGLYIRGEYTKNNADEVKMFLEKKGARKEAVERYLGMLGNLGDSYFKEQIAYPISLMALQCKEIGLDSLIIGGFDEDEVIKVLNIDSEKYGVGLLLAVGTSALSEKPQRICKNRSESVGFMTL